MLKTSIFSSILRYSALSLRYGQRTLGSAHVDSCSRHNRVAWLTCNHIRLSHHRCTTQKLFYSSPAYNVTEKWKNTEVSTCSDGVIGDPASGPVGKPSVVIFDKDGTLICFHTTWTPLAKDFVKRLEDVTGLELYHEAMSAVGFCHQTKKFGPGLLAEATVGQIHEELVKVLNSYGLHTSEAEKITKKAWSTASQKFQGQDQMIGQPEVIFKALKEHGIKVAICTSDTRKSTVQMVRKAGLEQYVDMLVCGDDENSEPKPSPFNAHRICNMLNVDISRAVVVGDTMADVQMGRTANVGTVVGVLSGVGQEQDLQKLADYVVPDIRHLIELCLPHADKSYCVEEGSK